MYDCNDLLATQSRVISIMCSYKSKNKNLIGLLKQEFESSLYYTQNKILSVGKQI